MRLRAGHILALAFPLFFAAPSGAADFCAGADDPDLIWSGCGGARLELRLLPEDAGPTPPGALDVTGAYTAVDQREGGRPRPVGLFVRRGAVAGREYARFDGVLVIDQRGGAEIYHRRNVRLSGLTYDLDDRDARRKFLIEAARSGGAVMQSHLLIVNGGVDVRPREDAPAFRRRILLQAKDGAFALYDSSPRALTLAEAAGEVAARYAPAMALNLDMGSYDFCRRGEELCGFLNARSLGKLSNILRLR